jgi:flagellar biosynthesis protein FlhF
MNKRFWGRNMTEALRAVRSALGADALIMETKNLPNNLGGGVEIVAAATDATAVDDEVETMPDAMPVEPQSHPQSHHPIDALREELSALKSMLGWLAPGLAHQDKIVNALIKHGVAPEIIAKLSDQAQRATQGDQRTRWFQAIASLVAVGGAIRASKDRLVLLGPAGVGKTASLIKLTVHETQRRACHVGWINMDQRGLAAADPLAVYSGILGARYEKAADRKELREALDRLADCDLILIDTPGVNPRDSQAVKALAKCFHGIPDLRRALLLSAATNGKDLSEWAAIFRQAGAQALFFTKLDECRYFGALLNTILAAALPVSYMTLGQNLAGDLEIAKPEIFSSLLLTGDNSDD